MTSAAHECSQCLTVRVRGLDCAEEVALLRKALASLVPAHEELTFDLMRGSFTVHRAPEQRDDVAILKAVRATGLRPEEPGVEHQAAAKSHWADHRLLYSAWASGVALGAAHAVHAIAHGPLAALLGSTEPPFASQILFIAATAPVLLHTAPKALAAVRFLRADMHLLMTIAIIGALLLREFSESGAVAFLFLISLLLESWNLERARRSVSALMDLAPATARVKCPNDGCLSERPVDSVEVGSLVVVRPGERIPLDGVLTVGETTVDQAAMTGESIPMPRVVGEKLLAGTINLTGEVEMRVEHGAQDTLLARMLRLVEHARARRAPAEQWVDSFARWYTPAMLVLAAGIAVLPPLIAGGLWTDWIYRALVVLVIACPCALVISTPVAITAALSRAARNGVLVKGGVYLEQMAGIRAIAFDKTGTLTIGRPEVAEVIAANGVEREALIAMAAALEKGSNHPIAQAIVRHAESLQLNIPVALSHHADHGYGVTGELYGESCWIGNLEYSRRWVGENSALDALASDGRNPFTLALVGKGPLFLGAITLRDVARPEAKEMIQSLRALGGIEQLRMLTGDHSGVAQQLGRELDLDVVQAELNPEDKVSAVLEMKQRLGAVALVGDGVNDAPALAAATVGIAMGAAGSDAALETADIALMEDRLERIPWLVRHARAAKTIIVQNITFALATKAVFLALTALGLAGLWGAITADMGASLLVLFNSLRLLRSA